ncbi:hypothetical protein CLV40_1387 [Actinokineospora auranticolor]|uniref:Uncharacterized protein n=1 Tax=Actinokineospora auranticolor TaxID=155976 RepID=A0A2S6GBX2_9PSEU|nr:hypothetical protein CLV40_1387 [Actinokineospora auranticolor]
MVGRHVGVHRDGRARVRVDRPPGEANTGAVLADSLEVADRALREGDAPTPQQHVLPGRARRVDRVRVVRALDDPTARHVESVTGSADRVLGTDVRSIEARHGRHAVVGGDVRVDLDRRTRVRVDRPPAEPHTCAVLRRCLKVADRALRESDAPTPQLRVLPRRPRRVDRVRAHVVRAADDPAARHVEAVRANVAALEVRGGGDAVVGGHVGVDVDRRVRVGVAGPAAEADAGPVLRSHLEVADRRSRRGGLVLEVQERGRVVAAGGEALPVELAAEVVLGDHDVAAAHLLDVGDVPTGPRPARGGSPPGDRAHRGGAVHPHAVRLGLPPRTTRRQPSRSVLRPTRYAIALPRG